MRAALVAGLAVVVLPAVAPAASALGILDEPHEVGGAWDIIVQSAGRGLDVTGDRPIRVAVARPGAAPASFSEGATTWGPDALPVGPWRGTPNVTVVRIAARGPVSVRLVDAEPPHVGITLRLAATSAPQPEVDGETDGSADPPMEPHEGDPDAPVAHGPASPAMEPVDAVGGTGPQAVTPRAAMGPDGPPTSGPRAAGRSLADRAVWVAPVVAGLSALLWSRLGGRRPERL